MEQNIKLAIQIFLIVWIYTQQKWILKPVDQKLDKIASKVGGFPERVIRLFQEAIDCHKCLSFWTILIATQNLFLALGFAWLAHITYKK